MLSTLQFCFMGSQNRNHVSISYLKSSGNISGQTIVKHESILDHNSNKCSVFLGLQSVFNCPTTASNTCWVLQLYLHYWNIYECSVISIFCGSYLLLDLYISKLGVLTVSNSKASVKASSKFSGFLVLKLVVSLHYEFPP